MTEREMQELLWNYPEKLLNEPLTKFRWEASSSVGRADLIFSDKLGRLLIIEVKKGRLGRGAIDQLVDYFGMVKREFPDRPVELMVIANSIPEERRLACEKYDIEPREISEKRFRDVAEEVGYKFSSEEQTAASHSGLSAPPLARSRHVGLPRKVEKAWYYKRDMGRKGHFLAFVNAKGNSSIRFFDAEDGTFLGRQYGTGDYQEAFRDYIAASVELVHGKQPNLEKECRERLPSPVLTELRRQIPKS